MTDPTPAPPGVFATTRWTVVLQARAETPDGRAALAQLCEAYWEPVHRFIRREGHDADGARELTQEFFARLLARPALGRVDPARGRFRSYLLGYVKHFLADRRDHAQRAKRGAAIPHTSLDAPVDLADGDAPPLEIPDPAGTTDDPVFDRDWAVAVMARAVHGLEREYGDAGKAAHFAVLKTWLGGEPPRPQAEAARDLGLSEGALKVAVHRLRKQFRERLRLELAQTLPPGADPQEELRYLVEVLSRPDAAVIPVATPPAPPAP